MIRLRMRTAMLARVRLAYSPLWECVISARVVRDPARHTLHAPWARRALAALRTAGITTDVQLLLSLVRDDAGYIADFIAPPPDGPGRTFEEELARLRATPGPVVRADLQRAARGKQGAGAAALLARYGATPQRLLDSVARAAERYWKLAVLPDWPRIETVLEGEILYRARALALEGPRGLFAGLHPAVVLTQGRGGTLTVNVDRPGRNETAVIGRAGLLLVPSVFTWPDVFTVTDRPWRPSVYYPARGAGGLWSADTHAGRTGVAGRGLEATEDALTLVAGRARARAIRVLKHPVTTTELARQLGCAAASASVQLTRLGRAGLVERVRVGRRVFYTASPKLARLLAALDPDGA